MIIPLVRKVCKEQDNLVKRERRSKKAATSFFKISYALGLSLFAYDIIKDKASFPKIFMGNGRLEDFYHDFPEVPQEHKVFQYYVVALGYHLAELLLMAKDFKNP